MELAKTASDASDMRTIVRSSDELSELNLVKAIERSIVNARITNPRATKDADEEPGEKPDEVPDEASFENQLLTPDDDLVSKEVQGETSAGTRHFLFQGARVRTTGVEAVFVVFVDITGEMARRRTIEQLYRETREILPGEDRKSICKRTIRIAEEVVDFLLAGICLYDRESEALESVAATSAVWDVFDEDVSGYTDTESIVWQTYRTGEEDLEGRPLQGFVRLIGTASADPPAEDSVADSASSGIDASIL